MRLGSNAGSNIPGSTLKEVVAFAIHQLASESWHLVLHLSHLGVEAFPYVGKFGVYYAEVTELDRNITLDTTVSHDFCIGHTCVSLHQKPLKDVRACTNKKHCYRERLLLIANIVFDHVQPYHTMSRLRMSAAHRILLK